MRLATAICLSARTQLTAWRLLAAHSNELDQFWSAKFIEDMDSAITALERKAALKEIDQVGRMASTLAHTHTRSHPYSHIHIFTR